MPAEPCAPGEIAVPGDATCRVLGDCGTSKWGNIPLDSSTQYVDASYLGGDSNGSAERPWGRIQAGVYAAAPGAVVAIAAGVYAEDVFVDKPVRIWGRCPELVSLEGIGSYFWALSLEVGSSNSEVRGLSITGPVDAVLVSGATGVVLEQLWLHDTGEWGLDVQSGLGPAEATLRDSLIEATQHLGVFVDGAGAVLHIDRSAVRDVYPTAAIPITSTAIVSQLFASVRVTQSIVERPPDVGVRAVNGFLALEGVLLRDQQRIGEGQAGVLVTANSETGDPSQATISASVIEGAVAQAIHATGSRADIDATTVLAPRLNGHGVTVTRYEHAGGPAEVTIRDSTIREAEEAAMVVIGGTLTAEGVLVRDVLPRPRSGTVGYGLSVQADRLLAAPSQATLRDSVIERASDVGIAVAGSQVMVEHTRVSDTRPSRALRGHGIHAQHDTVVDLPATLGLTDVLVERSYEFGIVAQNAWLSAERVTVRDTLPTPEAGTFGDGIALISDRAVESTLTAVRVEGSARAGIASFGARAFLGASELSCNTVQLVAEQNYGTPGSIQSLGENRCFCNSESQSCKVISAGLAPPPPLE